MPSLHGCLKWSNQKHNPKNKAFVNSPNINHNTTMKRNKTEILDRAIRLCEESETTLSNPGICLACGEEADGCEPDARNYECECCGEMKVFGAQEIIMMFA